MAAGLVYLLLIPYLKPKPHVIPEVVLKEKNDKIATLEASLAEAEARYKKLIGQKKSSEITTGLVVEHIAPFLAEFKHDPQKCRFIGTPIDFIVFEDKEIIFLEVKSGNSTLIPKQRAIRDLILAKKIRWEEVKITGNQKEEEVKKDGCSPI